MTLPLIPDNAPFTAPQRAWLNGFFAGIFSTPNQSPTSVPPGIPATSSDPLLEKEDEHPWHDPALPIDKRLELARGKPLRHQLMSAMAQLDCGACGYLCDTYSAAIASGAEKDLGRCSPGGTPTAKALKRILSSVPASADDASKETAAGQPATSAYTRQNPFTARIHGVTRLTHMEAPKDTRHVMIDLLDSGLVYEPGDALGICPVNCPDLVKGVLEQLATSGDTIVSVAGTNSSLRVALSTQWTLARVPSSLLELLANSAKDPVEKQELIELVAAEGGALAEADVCEILERFPSARPPLAEFLAALESLQPRLYSISSSLRKHPGQVHLTVGVVRFESAGRWRHGVASHFLGVRSQPGDSVRVFVHQSPKFRLPQDPSAPIIMIGPGTGIAPFIGFLQEREATSALGRNWLFFGNQYFEYDFLYRELLDRWADSKLLTRLDVAFSRDTAEKVYVQHRMLQQGAELWAWLEAGAYFYVCGDARRMAPDVDAALQQIIADHGRMPREAAQAVIARLRKEGRYARDVY